MLLLGLRLFMASFPRASVSSSQAEPHLPVTLPVDHAHVRAVLRPSGLLCQVASQPSVGEVRSIVLESAFTTDRPSPATHPIPETHEQRRQWLLSVLMLASSLDSWRASHGALWGSLLTFPSSHVLPPSRQAERSTICSDSSVALHMMRKHLSKALKVTGLSGKC